MVVLEEEGDVNMRMFLERQIGKQITSHGGYVSFFKHNPLRMKVAIVTCVTDARAVAVSTSLLAVDFRNIEVENDDVAPLVERNSLIGIFLSGTRVDNGVIEYLRSCSSLEFIGLERTRITRHAIQELREQLPKCCVYWNDDQADLEQHFASSGLSLAAVRRTFTSLK